MKAHFRRHWFWLFIIVTYLAYREYWIAAMILMILFKDMRIYDLTTRLEKRKKIDIENTKMIDKINAELSDLQEYKRIFFNNYDIKEV